MAKQTILTGIKPTGTPHIGNYIGAIKPALSLLTEQNRCLYFIADYHALTIIRDPKLLQQLCYEVAATWLALGLDPSKVIFYRQSDIPEVFELSWILSCLTPKGLMNRAHAYKAIVAENQKSGIKDLDKGVNMGLFTYPILMAADILVFNTDLVPVGKDQVQHVEIARDIAIRFNHRYGDTFRIPEYLVGEETAVIPGLDGRKMSKSYGNTIPLFIEPDKLRKLVFRIKTDSSRPDEPKDPSRSIIFKIYKEFATREQVDYLRKRYLEGISWGEAKQELFDVMNAYLEKPREIYKELMEDKKKIDRILKDGAERAREIAIPLIKKIRKGIGKDCLILN